MPLPSSVMPIRRRPPPSVKMSIRLAPASMAFSTSSLTTLAGRSTTSPAAMRLTTCSGSWRTGMDRRLVERDLNLGAFPAGEGWRHLSSGAVSVQREEPTYADARTAPRFEADAGSASSLRDGPPGFASIVESSRAALRLDVAAALFAFEPAFFRTQRRLGRRGAGSDAPRPRAAARPAGRWRRRGCAPGYGNAGHGSRSRRPWSCAGRRAGRAAPATSDASAIRRVSKRNCAAVESLLTFCPPGPEARTKLISMSFSSIVRSREIRSMVSPEAGIPWARIGRSQDSGFARSLLRCVPRSFPSPSWGRVREGGSSRR